MTLENAIKMLGKHGEVKQSNQEYYTAINGQFVGFLKNGNDGAACFYTRKVGHESDPQSDYDANNYWVNLTKAIRYAETGRSRK